MLDLKDYIRDVPDFPKPGILFRDITPLLASPTAFRETIERLTNVAGRIKPDVIVAIESRGFIFAGPVALNLGLPLVPVRKPGKLPAETRSVQYSLEYGTSQLDIHLDALKAGQKVVIIDDLLATGGTSRATAQLVEMLGAEVKGFLFVVELRLLEGRKNLEPFSTESLIEY